MRKILYLDYNSTTPLDPRVIDAMTGVMREHYANPSSRTHSAGWYVSELVEIAREQVALMLGGSPSETIFTSGATESINTVLTGMVARHRLTSKSAPHIVTVSTEHRATLDTARALEEHGTQVTVLPVDRSGHINVSELQSALALRPLLLSIMAVNNETGLVHDIPSVSALAREHGVLVHCDAVQAIGKTAFDVKTCDVDFVSLSAHKFYGPKGVGALWIRQGSPRPISLIKGGGQEQGLRAGTLNVPGIIGMGRAAEIVKTELDEHITHLKRLSEILVTEVSGWGNVHFIGDDQSRVPGTVNIAIERVPSERLLPRLAAKVAVSSSSACTSLEGNPSHVIAALGLDEELTKGAFRISCGRFTTEEELCSALSHIRQAVTQVRGG